MLKMNAEYCKVRLESLKRFIDDMNIIDIKISGDNATLITIESNRTMQYEIQYNGFVDCWCVLKYFEV